MNEKEIRDAEEQIKRLLELREFVVNTRRAYVSADTDMQECVDFVLKCQTAIRAIDETITEEKEQQKGKPAPFTWYVGGKSIESEPD